MVRWSLNAVRDLVRLRAGQIAAPAEVLPTFGRTEDAARPHVEIDGQGGFAYVVVERGIELSRQTTDDIDELLYWIFEDVTFYMASTYERRHRIEGEDSRRLMFTHQFGLLDRLDHSWTDRRKAQLGSILTDVGLA